VDRVMAGSSSKREDRLSAKLLDLMGAASSGGELPNRDIVTGGRRTEQGDWRWIH